MCSISLAMVNLHFSLLPRWRGAAPVERAILAGDPETGVDVMAVEEGLDTGGIYAEARVQIDDDITLAELRGLLVERGTRLLLDLLRDGIGEPRPQVGEPTYAAKIEPHEHELDWLQPAMQLARVVRLGEAWTTFRGRRLKVHRAHAVERIVAGAGRARRCGRRYRVGRARARDRAARRQSADALRRVAQRCSPAVRRATGRASTRSA